MGDILKIHVQRGQNLAVRDIITSDPYVVIKMGKQVINLASLFSSFVAQFWSVSNIYYVLPKKR